MEVVLCKHVKFHEVIYDAHVIAYEQHMQPWPPIIRKLIESSQCDNSFLLRSAYHSTF